MRVTNLYEERFQAVLGKEEHRGFMTAFRDGKVAEDVKGHVEDLQWCTGIVLCYPTWWYSFPAILKVTQTGSLHDTCLGRVLCGSACDRPVNLNLCGSASQTSRL